MIWLKKKLLITVWNGKQSVTGHLEPLVIFTLHNRTDKVWKFHLLEKDAIGKVFMEVYLPWDSFIANHLFSAKSWGFGLHNHLCRVLAFTPFKWESAPLGGFQMPPFNPLKCSPLWIMLQTCSGPRSLSVQTVKYSLCCSQVSIPHLFCTTFCPLRFGNWNWRHE